MSDFKQFFMDNSFAVRIILYVLSGLAIAVGVGSGDPPLVVFGVGLVVLNLWLWWVVRQHRNKRQEEIRAIYENADDWAVPEQNGGYVMPVPKGWRLLSDSGMSPVIALEANEIFSACDIR